MLIRVLAFAAGLIVGGIYGWGYGNVYGLVGGMIVGACVAVLVGVITSRFKKVHGRKVLAMVLGFILGIVTGLLIGNFFQSRPLTGFLAFILGLFLADLFGNKCEEMFTFTEKLPELEKRTYGQDSRHQRDHRRPNRRHLCYWVFRGQNHRTAVCPRRAAAHSRFVGYS